jgi:putative phosphoribosyl transferase
VRFADRIDAGRQLAAALEHLRGEDVVVLGLPRGGVPVAAEIAAALDAPLDVIVVRKLGTPGHEELGMGAIGEGGVRVLNNDIVATVGASAEQLAAVEESERAELERRAARFRGDRQRLDLTGKTAIVVDDGIATGSTAIAALQVARAMGAARTVLATPVAPHGIERRLSLYADDFVALDTPRWFSAVGQFYDDFDQTTDAEVIACLAKRT